MRPFSSLILLSLIAVIAAFLPGSGCTESPFPKASGPVNDFADAMSAPYEKRIGRIAEELRVKTGVELVLVTMRDLGGADPKEYVPRLYQAWAVGKNGKDRGVLIFVSRKEQTMRIHTGTGLKTVLSQRQIAEIQDRFVAPLLKQNDYDNGLLNGVVAIAKIIGKESGVALKEL